MADQENSKAKYWLDLLKECDSEDEKKFSWNTCLFIKFQQIQSLFPSKSHEKVEAIKNEYLNRLSDRELRKKWENYPALPPLPQQTNRPIESYMKFGNVEFSKNISFAGMVLIGADFSNAVFKRKADFTGAVFLGLTHFEGARFEGQETMSPKPWGVTFRNSVFCNAAYFNGTEFPSCSTFENAEFLAAGFFQDSVFGKDREMGGVVLTNAKIGAESSFSNARFFCDVGFDNVEFNYGATFEQTEFLGNAYFNNSKFKGTTIFREATFSQPPEFFEANVPEDVNFNGIDWHKAELSYSISRNKDETDKIKAAENAVLAWERLALIMSRQEKPWERHEFFRLRMRAKRHADRRSISISSSANWLFDKMSDYGWGIGRSFTWWFGHIVLFGVILTVTADYQIHENGGQSDWRIPRNGFLVSLSNSLSFLRLQGGYLNSYFEDLKTNLDQVMWLFSTVGTIQAILGPILLFLVLLTLRNRFRIG